MSAAEAARFMAGNAHPIRELVAEKVTGRPVVDLGCGRGIKIKDLYDKDRYFGVDCSPELISIAERDNPGFRFWTDEIVEFLQGIGDKCFSCAIMVSVLEHVSSLEVAQEIYAQARRVTQELFVGWHTPPHYPETKIIQVRSELDHPMWQNHYKEGSFGGAVDITKVLLAELWTVRD
jgi:trans-aconitate methyltransferase